MNASISYSYLHIKLILLLDTEDFYALQKILKNLIFLQPKALFNIKSATPVLSCIPTFSNKFLEKAVLTKYLGQGQLTVKDFSNRMLPRFQEPMLG